MRRRDYDENSEKDLARVCVHHYFLHVNGMRRVCYWIYVLDGWWILMKIKKTSEYHLTSCDEQTCRLLNMWAMLIGTDAEDWCRRYFIELLPEDGEKLFSSVKKDMNEGYEVKFV